MWGVGWAELQRGEQKLEEGEEKPENGGQLLRGPGVRHTGLLLGLMGYRVRQKSCPHVSSTSITQSTAIHAYDFIVRDLVWRTSPLGKAVTSAGPSSVLFSDELEPTVTKTFAACLSLEDPAHPAQGLLLAGEAGLPAALGPHCRPLPTGPPFPPLRTCPVTERQ